MCFYSQSCRQKATDIHELIIDNFVDVLMLTETWLYPQGDETYIATMTLLAIISPFRLERRWDRLHHKN